MTKSETQGVPAAYTDLYENICQVESATRNPRAMKTLRQLLRVYFRWLDAEDLNATELTPLQAEAYQHHCATVTNAQGAPYAAGTVKNLIKAARVVHRILKLQGLSASDPFAGIATVACRNQPITNVLSEIQMARLMMFLSDFSHPSTDQRLRHNAYRTHVVCELLRATGMRIAEAASLTLSDLNLAERRVWLPQGKNGAARMVYLTDEAVAALEFFITIGRAAIGAADSPLLFGVGYSSLTTTVNYRLAQAAKALSLPPITSHCFRHALGYHLLRSGCDLRYIQAILGHESIDSTKVYLKVDKDDLRNIITAHHPRARMHGHLSTFQEKRLPVKGAATEGCDQPLLHPQNRSEKKA